MVDRYWRELLNKFTNVELDAHIVMPNHLHGVIVINEDQGGHPSTALRAGSGSPLPSIIRWFKTMTTNAYMRSVRAGEVPPFKRRLWQRGYYEHIVRDEEDWSRIREYIENNPLHWEDDEENLARYAHRAGT